MNKCNFCKYSIPTGGIGAWKCSKEGYSFDREQECMRALKTMKEYNETRANNNQMKE